MRAIVAGSILCLVLAGGAGAQSDDEIDRRTNEGGQAFGLVTMLVRNLQDGEAPSNLFFEQSFIDFVERRTGRARTILEFVKLGEVSMSEGLASDQYTELPRGTLFAFIVQHEHGRSVWHVGIGHQGAYKEAALRLLYLDAFVDGKMVLGKYAVDNVPPAGAPPSLTPSPSPPPASAPSPRPSPPEPSGTPEACKMYPNLC